MSSGKVKCTCGWSWNKSDSSKKDMYICHECGRDNSNNMKNGGWLDSISKAQEGDTVNNATQEGIDALQSIYRNNGPSTMFGRLPFNVGSGIGLLQSHINNKPEKLSDQIGIFPNPYAQAASYMALYAEKEGENIRKFNENKYRGKDLSELAPEEDVNNRVIDKTYVPKPKIEELKENKKETKSKKVSYKEKKETNKVEIDNTRTVKPKVNTNYKPESKPKTKYKFDIPSITYSDKSFVMPREVNDTKIDNTYVAKPRRKNGGWLDQYADGGNIDDPNVGDPNPTYWKSKVYKGPTEFNECKGEGCSKQATKGVASLYNLDYSSLNPQDAWYKRSAVIKGGGKEIYNVSSKNDINSVYGDLRVGDFVSLDRPGESHSTDVSKVEGYDLSDNEKTEHLGYVVGFDKNGTPLIKHGWEGNLISGAKSYVQPITNISLPDIGYDYTVNSIYRASPLLNNDKEVSSKYYKNISPSIPLSFNNEKNLTDDKQKFIDAYNKNSDKFQVETGLLPEEVAAIGNISYGIFGNESRFNESLKRPVKQLGAETLDFFGLKDTPPSLGPTQIKYDQVGGDKNNTRKSKLLRSLGVKKEDLNNVILPTDYDAVSKATFALLAENYRNLKTNPKFKYNSETNTVLGNVPIGVALAKSWQNPSLKNVEETLQTGNSDYANSVYKNMSELEGNMFPIELEEVVVQRKKKKNGGWLDSYEDGGTMQEHQENYNDYKVSAPEGFKGTGYSNVGRDYSPAWGGQFQMGGKLKSNIPVIEDAGGYNEDGYWVPDWEAMTAQAKKLGAKRVKTKHGSLIVFDNNWEVIGVDDNPDAMQMGGNVYPVNYVPQAQEGKRLNPFTYPQPDHYSMNPFLVRDPQHGIFVGGINPTYSTKDFSIGASAVGVGNKDFIEPIVDYGIKGSYNPTDSLSINANISKENVGAGMSYRFENGGEINYPRTKGIPSEGPYAKKTLPSAQNGQEMRYYQNGLDWKPKGMKEGGWLNKYEEGGIVKGDQDGYRNPKNRGKVVEIKGSTMGTDGYDDTLYVVPDVGEPRIVYANTGNHEFPGATKFREYPMAQGGYTTGDEVKYGTPEYEEAYNRGEVVTEDGQYSPILLEEVIIPGRPLTEFGKTRKEIASKNTWEQFANDRYLGKLEKNMGQTLDNLPEYRKQEYEDYVNKLAFDEYVKTHPQAKGEKRGAYIDRMQTENANSLNFERAYEANAEYNPSTDVNLWRKSLMGLGSLVMGTPALNKLKQKSDYYSTKEKQYIDENPGAAAFDTTLGTLAPLEIPGNMLYGKNNSALEALSGRPSDVPMEARILGDPLMPLFEAAPLIGKGMSYLGSKGSQALAKASEASAPTLNKAKTLIDDMSAVMLREVKTIDPKLNAISDAESAIYQTPEYTQFAGENLKLRQQKWALEGKVNQLKNKGQTAELNSLNDRINKLNKRIDVAEQFTVNGEGLVQSGKDTSLGLRTGSTDIMDLATGEKFPISTSVPGENVIHRLEGDQVVKSIDNSTLPQASPEYNTTVKKNIDFIETQIPGAKVFGSAKNVAETEVPHIIGDYDVLMSQTQYDKFAKANPSVGNNGFAELHNIPGAAKGVDPIDINIIQEKGGKAIGTRAEELFKQMAPDEYYAAAKKAIKDKSEIKIPYSSQQLVDMSNPTTKSVVDAYESSKGKHINKIDALINYGKPSVIAEGQQQFVNSLVGSKGSIGHQFPLEQLSNAETNAEILDKINFIGNKKLVAADPQRMQLAINDYYMNNSILARQVDKDKINKIEASIKEYYPGAKGGAVNGIGQNHVTLGFPNHGDKEILSMKQLGMNLDTADPLSYINSIEHQVSGEKLFSQEERAILSNILKDMKFYDHEKQLAEGSENASQLISNLPYSEEGKKALYEFGKQTNRTMAKKAREYGNSTFVATLRDFDDAIDAMQYQLIDKEYMNKPERWLKSFDKRTQAAEYATRNQANISTDLELLPKQFKAIKGYVEGGMDKANQRLTTLNAERTRISDDITAISDKLYNKKYKDELDRLNAFRTKIEKEIGDMNQMRRDLHDRKVLLRNLEEKMKTVGILGGGSATLIGLGAYGYKEQNEIQKKYEKEMLKDMLKNMSKEEREEYQRKTDSIQQREDRPFIDKASEWFVTPIGEYKKNGGSITKAKNGNQLVKLDQLTNFTNYNKPQPGGWLNKYN